MLMMDGSSMETATAAPPPKFGMAPSISLYKWMATTSKLPPMEAGMPKSVKLSVNDWINAAPSVPTSGLTAVPRKVRTGPSPITLETMAKFLSTYLKVLLISRKAIGSV